MKKYILLVLLAIGLAPGLKKAGMVLNVGVSAQAQDNHDLDEIRICSVSIENLVDTWAGVEEWETCMQNYDCDTEENIEDPYNCTTDYREVPQEDVDCNGDEGGSAYMADCGCIGGSTGIEACLDCNGDMGGSAYLASCGCIGGDTGIDECPPDDGEGPPPEETPCGIFASWIQDHPLADAEYYYDNTIGQKYNASSAVCQNGTKCPSLARYWGQTSNQVFYYKNGWEEYKPCSFDPCLPITFNYAARIANVGNPIGNSFWCSFYNLAAIKGGDACHYAEYYYRQYNAIPNPKCNTDFPANTSNLVEFYLYFGVTLTSVSISSECDMVEKLRDKTSYIVDVSGNHVSLVYGIKRDAFGTYNLCRFDTSKQPADWDQTDVDFSDYDQGGGDYVAKK